MLYFTAGGAGLAASLSVAWIFYLKNEMLIVVNL